jgi:hypothetical protein
VPKRTRYIGENFGPINVSGKSTQMAISQNVRFFGDAPPDEEFAHPPGASIIRLLQAGLADHGWQVAELDNWRDCGWSIACSRKESMLDVVLAKTAIDLEWMAQIAPTYVPGLIGGLLGKSASAPPALVFALAKDIHVLLSKSGCFSEFKWCWDGNPVEDTSSQEPVETEGNS